MKKYKFPPSPQQTAAAIQQLQQDQEQDQAKQQNSDNNNQSLDNNVPIINVIPTNNNEQMHLANSADNINPKLNGNYQINVNTISNSSQDMEVANSLNLDDKSQLNSNQNQQDRNQSADNNIVLLKPKKLNPQIEAVKKSILKSSFASNNNNSDNVMLVVPSRKDKYGNLIDENKKQSICFNQTVRVKKVENFKEYNKVEPEQIKCSDLCNLF